MGCVGRPDEAMDVKLLNYDEASLSTPGYPVPGTALVLGDKYDQNPRVH